MRRRQTRFIQSRSHSTQGLHPGGFGGSGDVGPELGKVAFDLFGCVVRRRLPHCQLTLPAHAPHCEFTLPAHTPQCLPAHTASRVGLCRRRSVSTLPPPRLFCSNAGPAGIAPTAGRSAADRRADRAADRAKVSPLPIFDSTLEPLHATLPSIASSTRCDLAACNWVRTHDFVSSSPVALRRRQTRFIQPHSPQVLHMGNPQLVAKFMEDDEPQVRPLFRDLLHDRLMHRPLCQACLAPG